MTDIEAIERDLAEGFYIRNLENSAGRCMDAARAGIEPVVFYVLASIFDDISRQWEGRPTTVDETNSMEEKILGKVKNLVASVTEKKDHNEIWDDLNQLLSAFFS